MPGYFGDYQGPYWWDEYFFPDGAGVAGPPYFVVASELLIAGARTRQSLVAGSTARQSLVAGAIASQVG